MYLETRYFDFWKTVIARVLIFEKFTFLFLLLNVKRILIFYFFFL